MVVSNSSEQELVELLLSWLPPALIDVVQFLDVFIISLGFERGSKRIRAESAGLGIVD